MRTLASSISNDKPHTSHLSEVRGEREGGREEEGEGGGFCCEWAAQLSHDDTVCEKEIAFMTPSQ